MTTSILTELFGLEGRVAVVTGGSGVLGGAMARGLALAGAKVAVLGRDQTRADQTAEAIRQAGGESMALSADVLDEEQLKISRQNLLEKWGRLDILVNAAGGNTGAIIGKQDSFFDMPIAAFNGMLDLNLTGTVLPTLVFGRTMWEQRQGNIINISSMAAMRALSRGVGYGAAKAAISNFTQWLATELTFKYGAGLRVNAIAPGFFVGDQNRALLVNPDGTPTERGQLVINHTPAGRFGEANELVSTLLWLCGPGASFVNGIVVPVDGGFSAFSGV